MFSFLKEKLVLSSALDGPNVEEAKDVSFYILVLIDPADPDVYKCFN